MLPADGCRNGDRILSGRSDYRRHDRCFPGIGVYGSGSDRRFHSPGFAGRHGGRHSVCDHYACGCGSSAGSGCSSGPAGFDDQFNLADLAYLLASDNWENDEQRGLQRSGTDVLCRRTDSVYTQSLAGYLCDHGWIHRCWKDDIDYSGICNGWIGRRRRNDGCSWLCDAAEDDVVEKNVRLLFSGIFVRCLSEPADPGGCLLRRHPVRYSVLWR